MIHKIVNAVLGKNYVATALLYTGLALVIFAIAPSQAQLRAGDDECGGACEEGQVCMGNEGTGRYSGNASVSLRLKL